MFARARTAVSRGRVNGSAPSIRGGRAPCADCAILGIFGLLIYYTGARLTDSHGSHAFELGALCGSAESDLITPWVWWVFLPSSCAFIIAHLMEFVKGF